jgi:hypothetical protein
MIPFGRDTGAPKMMAGSVATPASNTTEPSRLLTTQTAVLEVDIKRCREFHGGALFGESGLIHHNAA